MRNGLRRLIGKSAALAHWRRSIELQRLLRRRRFLPTTTRLLGPRLDVPDGPSFVSMYRSIFLKQTYRFTGDGDPFIIDGGANIGLSVIYFRRLFPGARIVAFEADPHIFAVLTRNLAAAGIEGVDLRHQALADRDGTLDFQCQGADGGRVLDPGAAPAARPALRVPAVRLSPLLDRDVDLLKLDIEGSETAVLRECSPHLGRVRRCFVEYHSFAGREQTLDEVLSILRRAGLRVHVQVENGSPQPFCARRVSENMDLQLNIFAFRPGAGSERPA